jgi:hypothetical protein
VEPVLLTAVVVAAEAEEMVQEVLEQMVIILMVRLDNLAVPAH